MTGEQRAQRDELQALAEQTGRRLRIVEGFEGWPIVPGSRGQVEVIGYPGGALALAVYTRTPRVFRELVALPGVRRLQVGDSEFRVLAPWSAEALVQLTGIIRARTRRPSTVPAALVAAREARLLERRRCRSEAPLPGAGATIAGRVDSPATPEPSALLEPPSNRPAA